jgi:hypothetical protein
MAYYRRYRSRYRRESARDALSRYVGEIDKDVLEIFYGLSARQLDLVLEWYGSRHGADKARYARSSYPQWKSGSKKMSGEIVGRMLDVVPPALDFQTRVELLRRIRQRHIRGRTVSIVVRGPGDLPSIDRAAEELIQEANGRDLPEYVTSKLDWLSDGDSAVAHQLLAASELATAQLTRAHLRQEMQHLEQLFRSKDNISLRHTLRLAGGSLDVQFKKKWWWMSDSSSDDPKHSMALAKPIMPDLLALSLQRLEGPAGAALLATAQREALQLQVDEYQRQMRRALSQQEMDDFVARAVRTFHQVNTTTTHVDMRGDFTSATGSTQIHMKSRFCYVATVAYGSEDAWQVIALREFRDQRLLPHTTGRVAVSLYYKVGPWAARLLSRRPTGRLLARRVLDALVRRLSATRA